MEYWSVGVLGTLVSGKWSVHIDKQVTNHLLLTINHLPDPLLQHSSTPITLQINTLQPQLLITFPVYSKFQKGLTMDKLEELIKVQTELNNKIFKKKGNSST